MNELHKIREKHYRHTTSARAKKHPGGRLVAQRLQAESRLVQVDSHAVLREFERLVLPCDPIAPRDVRARQVRDGDSAGGM
jgi:hypothetical protein